VAPGYRVGWIVPGTRFAEPVRRHKLAMNIATAAPPQLAIAEYLESGGYDTHLRRLRRILRNNVARLAGEVAARFPEGTQLSQPAGGFVLWVQLPVEYDSLALHARAREAGISICPGPIFSASGGFRNCLRLSAGHTWSIRSERALDRLANLLPAARRGE
jgi:DNA-binding transcriptional MocR family regulator